MTAKVDPDYASQYLGHTSTDFRASARRAEQDRVDLRRRELEQQCAADSTPQERILLWERLHGVRLPVASGHPLITVVAEQTQLSVRDVRDEQQRRSAQQQRHAVKSEDVPR